MGQCVGRGEIDVQGVNKPRFGDFFQRTIPWPGAPALFTRMSRLPQCSVSFSTTHASAVSSVTSQAKVKRLPAKFGHLA